MLIFDFIANVLFPTCGTVYHKTFNIFNASGLHLIHKRNIKFDNDFFAYVLPSQVCFCSSIVCIYIVISSALADCVVKKNKQSASLIVNNMQSCMIT